MVGIVHGTHNAKALTDGDAWLRNRQSQLLRGDGQADADGQRDRILAAVTEGGGKTFTQLRRRLGISGRRLRAYLRGLLASGCIMPAICCTRKDGRMVEVCWIRAEGAQ